MPDYSGNIRVCLLARNREGVSHWVKRTIEDLTEDTVKYTISDVFNSLFSLEKFDIADDFFETLPLHTRPSDYQKTRAFHLARIAKELEQRKRVEESSIREKEERERRQREIERTENLRQQAIGQLREGMVNSFLDVHELFSSKWKKHLKEDEFHDELKAFVQSWFKENLPPSTPERFIIIPDDEQALAIACGKRDTLVVARAGSGKTATIVNRAFFLQRHCGLDPQQILLLAFNKKAAEEMKERLEDLTQRAWPHVMTFHALAWAIVRPEEEILFNEDANERLHAVVQEVIDDQLRNPEVLNEIRELMLARWRSDWERLEEGGYDKTGPEFLQYRRSLPRETLRGEYVKSYGEKAIANFFFEHDLGYKYEHPHRWDERIYRPDFTHFCGRGGIIIEYFGLKGDPDYDAQTEEKRSYWQKRPDWTLLEVTPADVARDDFETWLRQSLEQLGVSCNRLSEDEIWERARQRAIDRFSRAVTGFILRARKLCIDVDDLERRVSGHQCETPVEEMFLRRSVPLYASYLDRLRETGEDDFDGLLARAVHFLSTGNTGFNRKSGHGDLGKMKFVFVDEYQDFTELFFQLLSGIRAQNPLARFFCVGDDWQAINGFAGSDLAFFHGFEGCFDGADRLYLSTNYRSCEPIVEIGNSAMAPLGGRPARAHRKDRGKVLLADISVFLPTDHEREVFGGSDAAFHRIIADSFNSGSSIFDDLVDMEQAKDIVFLCRTNHPPWVSKGLDGEDGHGLIRLSKAIKKQLPKEQRPRVRVSTTHKFKGLQGCLVVVVDALEGRYPLIHPDWVLMRIFGDTLQKVIDEDRRLFYVALTRAEDVLVVVTDAGEPSPFLEDVDIGTTLKWDTLRKVTGGGSRLVIMVGNADERSSSPTFNIKDHLKADGFRFVSTDWPSWRKSLSAEDFDIKSFFSRCSWSGFADGVEIRVCSEDEDVLERYVAQQGSLQIMS